MNPKILLLSCKGHCQIPLLPGKCPAAAGFGHSHGGNSVLRPPGGLSAGTAAAALQRPPDARVILADMRRELRDGNAGCISRELARELEKNLEAGEQSILFLNRRGSSRMLLCGECGYVPSAPVQHCHDYHSANGRLMCTTADTPNRRRTPARNAAAG